MPAQKDRSDFAVMNRMIDHIRLLIAVDDEAIPVKKKLETQAILKDFQALLAEPPESQERGRIKHTMKSCAAISARRPTLPRCSFR